MQAAGRENNNSTDTVHDVMPMTKSPVVLFDGVCNLCNNAVKFILRHDKRQIFLFSSLQSDYGRLLVSGTAMSGQGMNSVIFYDQGQFYTHSDAIIRIAEILGGFYKLAAAFRIIPKSIRDALYNFVANHRYRWFGKRESCMTPDAGISDRFLR